MNNSRFYHTLLTAYASAKRWDRVEGVIRGAAGVLTSRQTFNLRVRMATEQGDIAGMQNLRKEAQINNLTVDDYCYYHLLKGFTTRREIALAEELFMEMQRREPMSVGCPVYVLMFDLYFKTKNSEKVGVLGG